MTTKKIEIGDYVECKLTPRRSDRASTPKEIRGVVREIGYFSPLLKIFADTDKDDPEYGRQLILRGPFSLSETKLIKKWSPERVRLC